MNVSMEFRKVLLFVVVILIFLVLVALLPEIMVLTYFIPPILYAIPFKLWLVIILGLLLEIFLKLRNR